jgi:hypothetical protein
VALENSGSTDGFEDQDYSEYDIYGTDTTDWGFSTNAKSGTYAAEHTGDGDNNHELMARGSATGAQTVKGWVSTQNGRAGFKIGASAADDGIRYVIDAGAEHLLIRDESAGASSSTSVSLSSGTYYYVVAKYWAANETAKAWVDDDTDYHESPLATVIQDGGSQDGQLYGLWQFDAGSDTKRWDDVTFSTDAESPESARYLHTHSVTNSKEAAINLLEVSDVSVDATIRTDGGTVLNQTTLTTAGNHTLSLSETSSEQLEVILEIDVIGSDPRFVMDDESILFDPRASNVDGSNADPQGDEAVNDDQINLSVPISDPDFGTAQGDSVTVDIVLDSSVVATKTITSNQTVSTTVSGLADGNHTWHVETADSYGETTSSAAWTFEINHFAPVPDNAAADPQGGEEKTTRSVMFSVPVNDSDFAEPSGHEVQATFYLDGTEFASKNISQNGTVTASTTVSAGGNHEWYVEFLDEHGLTNRTDADGSTAGNQPFTFLSPSELTIRNERNPKEILDNVQVNITAYYSNETLRRNTTDGTVNLTGFPTDEPIIVRAGGENYTTRTVVIESIYQQANVYLLPSSVETYEVRFGIQDSTGLYSTADTVLFVERDLKLNDSVEWRTIAGDNFGVQGVPVILRADERYRLRVKNLETGTTATIGAYTAIQSETVTLSPGTAQIGIIDSEMTYGWSAIKNESSQFVLFEYLDTESSTDSVTLTIHERYNASNVLVDNTTFSNANNIVYQQPLSATETNTTWMAEIYVERNGSVEHFREPITGPRADILPEELDGVWRAGVGAFVLIIVGMAFSQLDQRAGALSTALVGGVLWQVGLLSTVTTGPAVVLAIGITVLYNFIGGQT